MLYVFIVTSGNMIQLEMNLAVKKVKELKKEISKCTNFPVEDQVLLCSGGEELNSENMVGNYHGAGTDTNPIFLFRKHAVNCDAPNPLPPECSLDATIADDVMNCANMVPSMQALSVRSNLAQRFADCALRGKQECNILVHHQHLQQQGWAAVIANLGDWQTTLTKRKQHFDEIFNKYLENRTYYLEIINKFPEDVALLSKIPLLKKLILNSECSEEDLDKKHTLLSWFCDEPEEVLGSVLESVKKVLHQLDIHSMTTLNIDLAQVLKNTEHQELKELKGIGERLTDLNKLMLTAKSYEKDQRELCKGFFNQTQIQHARDPNVLPDICKTFQNQLELMLQNHKCLEDILTKCNRAKIQLCDRINLHVKIISQVESEMLGLQNNIDFLEKYVIYATNRIESFRQVHMAPERYFKMLSEVCRRKEFSKTYIKWATELSSQVSQLYSKECSIRSEFSKEDNKNMVDNLFPGMDDEPPKYAVECPQPFDQNMPDITKEDLEWLKIHLPELASFCEVLPPEPMPYTCQAESDSAFSSNIPSSLKINSLENSHSNILKVHAKISALQKHMEELHLFRSILADMKTLVMDGMNEKKSFASDAAGKISSCIEMFQTQILSEKEAAINEAKKEFTSKENAYISRLEVESQKLHDAEKQILHLQEYLTAMSSQFEEVNQEKDELMLKLQEKGEVIKKLMLEHEIEFDSVKNQMKDVLQNQDSKIADLKEALSKAKSETEQLIAENSDIKLNCDKKINQYQETCTKLQEEMKNMREQMISLQSQANLSKNIPEMEEKLSEAMQENSLLKKHLEDARLKIAESDVELQQKEKVKEELQEKIKELESACDQLTVCVSSKNRTESGSEVLDSEAVAVSESAKNPSETPQEQVTDLELLQQMHVEALEKLKSRITAENQVSFNEAISRLVKEKDTTIEDLKSQISGLETTLNVIKNYFDKYLLSNKSRLAMSQSDFGASRPDSLPQSEEYQLIVKLQREIEPLIKSTLTMQPVQSSQYNFECLKKKFEAKELEYQRIIAKNVKVLGNPDCFQCCSRISILTCEKNDLVLLWYDDKYRNFVILQMASFLHFLHTDSMQALNLKIPPAGSLKGAQSSQLSSKPSESSERWIIGVVESKEFCITRKKENRYNVPIGTKFHRVKVRPWDRDAGCSIHQCYRSFQMEASSAAVTKSVCARSPSDDGAGSTRDMSASSI